MSTDINWPWETLEPGIYFDLPFDEYLDQTCMNASYIKDILQSPSAFWAKSWMNPFKADQSRDSTAMNEGTAYHTRILEGEAEFSRVYAPKFLDDGDKTALRTMGQMRDFLKQHDVRGYSSKSAHQLGVMCRDADPDAKVIPILEHEHKKKFEGKEFIAADTWRNIQLMAKMVELHPELKTYFAGGFPEVTIIWDDEELGVRFKIRVDYLKICPVCDLKTYANQMGKQVDKAIIHAIASLKYHIQGWLYLRGVNVAKKFIQEGKVFNADHVPVEWLEAFATNPAEEFWYVFIQNGLAPIARGKKWHIKDTKFDSAGRTHIFDAVRTFKKYYGAFEEDIWVDLAPSEFINFDDLPPFAMDI